MNIKEIWKVFKGSSMNDVDMQRAFERAATPNACIELIEENEMLIAALDHIKKHQETVVVGMPQLSATWQIAVKALEQSK
mgnify:CR=1 FL=1